MVGRSGHLHRLVEGLVGSSSLLEANRPLGLDQAPSVDPRPSPHQAKVGGHSWRAQLTMVGRSDHLQLAGLVASSSLLEANRPLGLDQAQSVDPPPSPHQVKVGDHSWRAQLATEGHSVPVHHKG